MKVVGLAGGSGTGKSTIAAHLVDRGAGHIDADRVGNHGVVARQDAANRQPVADVRVGHERGLPRDRHLARLPHLCVGGVVDAVGAPGAVRDRVGSNELTRLDERRREGTDLISMLVKHQLINGAEDFIHY